MTSLSYDDAAYPVRPDILAAHQRAWQRLAGAGTWLTGEQRVNVMAEVRHARDCPLCAEIRQALSPYGVDGDHASLGQLPEHWIDMIHRMVADPGRLTHGWYKRVLAGGIPDTHFVEIVSVVAHTLAIDTFARGLGVAARDLPEPRPGEPTHYRPGGARQHEAWAPNIAQGEHGAHEADLFKGYTPNILRAMTLVPDEVRSFFGVAGAQYLSFDLMANFDPSKRALARMQIELLAARVSALNQCTY